MTNLLAAILFNRAAMASSQVFDASCVFTAASVSVMPSAEDSSLEKSLANVVRSRLTHNRLPTFDGSNMEQLKSLARKKRTPISIDTKVYSFSHKSNQVVFGVVQVQAFELLTIPRLSDSRFVAIYEASLPIVSSPKNLKETIVNVVQETVDELGKKYVDDLSE